MPEDKESLLIKAIRAATQQERCDTCGTKVHESQTWYPGLQGQGGVTCDDCMQEHLKEKGVHHRKKNA